MAQLQGPYDVAFDAAGNLLVADGPRVVQIDARGMLTRVRGDFLTASTIAPLPAGDIFVAGPEVKRITSSGLVFSITGPFGLQAAAPGSVSIAYRSVMDSGLAPIATATPALFTSNLSPSGPAIALNQDGSLNSVTNPARKGSVVVLYGTGTGETEPISVSGQAAPLTPLHVVRLPLTAKIGCADTEVLFAGAAPGFVGLTQFNVRIPEAAAGRGPVRVEITVGGVPLNQTLVTIAIE